MAHYKNVGIIRRSAFGILALILTSLYPSAASFADDTPVSNTVAGQSQTTSADQPSGDDATTYHYNATTGKWENEHYIWDPATRTTTPKDNVPYSYNPATGRWDTTQWRYNAATSKWEPNTISVSQPPANSQTVGGPNDTNAATANINTINSDAADTTTTASAPSATTTSNSYFGGFYNAAISNTGTSTAQSGNATVIGNNTAGNAVSGDATAISNVFNLLQSTSGLSDLNGVNTFVTNIDGDVTGDLFIDPTQLAKLQPATSSDGIHADNHVNVSQNNTITNDLIVGATTGDAIITGNNTAGNAVSGNANAVANLVNMINTSIAANQSFIGTLNINGNLNGDILLPPEVLQTLLASNAPTATISLSPTDRAAIDATLANNQTVTNTVTTSATTGNATISNNNTAGNAKSGSSQTNITVLNLTGRQIVGSDSLLVFVNVLGRWVGALINAPQGATAAALGGGITQNDALPANNTDVTVTGNDTITNNVTVLAASGDATVTHNRKAGDATSGDATASANVANVTNSHVSLGGWFGMLFINVFGSWFGSFGVNTNAGDKPTSNSNNTDDLSATASSDHGVRVFRFTAATTSGNGNRANGSIAAEVAPETSAAGNPPRVLGVETAQPTDNTPRAALPKIDFNFPVGALSIGGGLFSAERAFSRAKHGRH